MQLYERFRPGQKPPTKLGSSRDYNVDMVPKFIMAGGELVRVLVHTGVATGTQQLYSPTVVQGSTLFQFRCCVSAWFIRLIWSLERFSNLSAHASCVQFVATGSHYCMVISLSPSYDSDPERLMHLSR